MNEILREERIYMRVKEDEKDFLRQAAELAGFTNLTNFILVSAKQAAQKIMDEHTSRVLSDRDRDLVLSLLENPPQANENLKKLFQEYIDKENR